MPGEITTRRTELPSLTLEEGSDSLRCQAAPRPVARLLTVGVGVIALIVYRLVVAVQWLSELNERQRSADLAYMQVAVCTLLLIVVAAVLWRFIRRYRKPREMTIEGGQIRAITPEQPVAEHVLACAELRAAELSTGRNMKPGIANLRLLRHSGPPVVAFTGFPADELAHVVDAINRFVRIDQFHAFEVLVATADEPNAAQSVHPVGPLRVLPADAPLRVLPVEPERR